MKIIVSGGLGNQMFQYALYLSLKEKGKNVSLDTSFFYILKMHNGYELEKIFNLDSSYSNDSKLYTFYLRIIMKFRFYPFAINDRGDFNHKVFTKKPMFLLGYWQSERYFENIQSTIKRSFQFVGIDKLSIEFYKEIMNCNSISLHVRRGDYEGLESVANICTTQYYLNAINYILARVDNPVFYVFSNDILYCERIFKDVNCSMKYVSNNINKDSYKDMYLMTGCQHNIIANSSFSWWGAWLNSNQNKIVISPNKWVNDNELKNETIIPENWIRINSLKE